MLACIPQEPRDYFKSFFVLELCCWIARFPTPSSTPKPREERRKACNDSRNAQLVLERRFIGVKFISPVGTALVETPRVVNA